MKVAFYDLETQCGFSEVQHISELKIACGVVRKDKSVTHHMDDDNDIKLMIKRLKKADLIVTFNGIRFDNVILSGYPGGDEIAHKPQYDIMVELQRLIGKRPTLAHVYKENFDGFEKYANGKQALLWYQKIQWLREVMEVTTDQAKLDELNRDCEDTWGLLLDYCERDVEGLARLMGRIKNGIPIKLKRFWGSKDFELVKIKLPNPFETGEVTG